MTPVSLSIRKQTGPALVADEGQPTLVVLAGPNGAGKSTLYETRIAPKLAVPFINADFIQRDELKDARPEAAYEAARIAEERRRLHMRDRKSFATETVFSHQSKLELIDDAKSAGYRVVMFHVSVDDSSLSVARVEERVKEGGHRVPEAKIRARYDRNGPLIRQAVLKSDFAHVFDNSKLNVPPVRILSFTKGKISFVAPRLPDWALKVYGTDLTGP